MNRRKLLGAAAGSSVLGASLLSGCLANARGYTTCISGGLSYEWCFAGDVEFDTVAGDTVFCRRDITDRRAETREVLALSAETGSTNWSYETERSVDHFTALTVDDGIFLTRSGPQDGNGLVALNMDGTERWIQDTAVGYERPRVANDTVYVSRDTGLVQAFDAASGDRRWKKDQDRRSNPRIVAVTDTVTVETDYTVLGLDPTAGTVQWEFDTGEQLILETRLLDGIMYVLTSGRIAAVSDGDEQWSTTLDTTVEVGTKVIGATSDRVFVFGERADGDGFRLHGFDTATGERSWTSEAIQRIIEPNFEWVPRATVFGDVAYLGGETLRALDATTGDERWRASVGDGPITILTVIDDGVTEDHTVLAGDRTQLATFTPDGEQTWTQSIEAPEWVAAEGEYLFTGTENAIIALDRPDGA